MVSLANLLILWDGNTKSLKYPGRLVTSWEVDRLQFFLSNAKPSYFTFELKTSDLAVNRNNEIQYHVL